MGAEEARSFVVGNLFSFTCFVAVSGRAADRSGCWSAVLSRRPVMTGGLGETAGASRRQADRRAFRLEAERTVRRMRAERERAELEAEIVAEMAAIEERAARRHVEEIEWRKQRRADRLAGAQREPAPSPRPKSPRLAWTRH